MLKLHFAGPSDHPYVALLGSIEERSKALVVGAIPSAAMTIEALGSDDVDAVLFPADRIASMRTILTYIEGSPSTPLIVMTEQESKPTLVLALAYGFSGMIHVAGGPDLAAAHIAHIIDGTWTFENDPSLQGLAVSRGLLTRHLTFSDADDQHIADLVGTGLPDEDIAFFMEWTVQRVRNRIEHLLVENDLSFRTQLAVVQAASLKVPDFS